MKNTTGFEPAINLAPVKDYIERHGRVRAVTYDPRQDAVLLCLQYCVIPYMRAAGRWSVPLVIPGEFLATVTVKDEVLIMTTDGIFTFGDDLKETE